MFDAEIIREQLETVMKRKVTGEHVELVLEWEREQARCRGWVACFPCPSMGRFDLGGVGLVGVRGIEGG